MRCLPAILIISLVIPLLFACESEPVEKTVWDEQLKTLEKAHEVEDKLMQRADQLTEELEKSGEQKKKEDRY